MDIQIAAIGLGRMGAALAGTLLKNNYMVMVWNRTASKGIPLLKDGAIEAMTASDAIESSDIIFVCLGNYDDCNAVLTDCGDLTGKTLIQLTSGTASEAEALQAWAIEKGALYLDGVILAYPSGIGSEETMLVVGGSASAWVEGEAVINCLGGASMYVGNRLTTPYALESALVTPSLMAIMGVIQGMHVLEKEGFDLSVYAEIISTMSPLLMESLRRQASAIATDNFTDTEASLETWAAGLGNSLEAFRKQGFNTDLLKPVHGLLTKAVDAGHGNEEIAAVIKVLREE